MPNGRYYQGTQIWSSFPEICTRGSVLTVKNSLWKTFEKSEFLQEHNRPKVCTFGPTLKSYYPLKMAEIKTDKFLHYLGCF